jgi:hypothetical protein
MAPHLAEWMPPLLRRPFPEGVVDDPFHALVAMPLPIQCPDAEDYEKAGMKERNRLAAQKWRQKKDRYLIDLETANDALRKQALDLTTAVQFLKVENRLLQQELLFFQHFMSTVMNPPK